MYERQRGETDLGASYVYLYMLMRMRVRMLMLCIYARYKMRWVSGSVGCQPAAGAILWGCEVVEAESRGRGKGRGRGKENREVSAEQRGAVSRRNSAEPAIYRASKETGGKTTSKQERSKNEMSKHVCAGRMRAAGGLYYT